MARFGRLRSVSLFLLVLAGGLGTSWELVLAGGNPRTGDWRAHSEPQVQTPVISAPRDLGTLGGSWSVVTHLSESGVVAGMSALPGDTGVSAFAWTESTGMVSLGDSAEVTDVNDNGMVVGWAGTAGQRQAFVWTPSGGRIDIGTLGGESRPTAVNNAGVVVGSSYLAGDVLQRAFMWTQQGGMVDLGTLAGTSGGDSHAAAISETGIIVGSSVALVDVSSVLGFPRVVVTTHAFAWTAGTGMVDLGTLGTLSADAKRSFAMAVNDSGLVAGLGEADAFQFHGFVWTSTEGMIDLGPESAVTVAPSGVVVGYRSAPASAFAWTRDGGRVELSLGGAHSFVSGLNNAGTVVGHGYLPPGSPVEFHAFVWNPATGLVDLGARDGFRGSAALAINNNGVVVGLDYSEFYDSNAGFIWTEQHGRINFPASTLGIERIARINDAGTVAGATLDTTGSPRATIWTVDFSVPANVAPTPAGTDVTVQPIATLPDGSTAPVSLSFDSVATSGTATVETSATGPPLPGGFKLGEPPIYYDVETTAVFSGAVTLCFTWQEGQLHNEGNARLLHFENGTWVDVTTSVDTLANIVCGNVTSLSPFVIAELAYQFLGFGPPLLSDGSASIQQTKAGRTIPVKFQLRFNGQLTGAATATIAVYRILNVATGTVDTTDLTEDAGTANENSDRFRFDAAGQQYIYNLNTKGWSAPATYRIVVTLDDGATFTVDFSLR